MKAVIHQPMYFPYPGFFHKLSLADIFVIMDDVQYDKRFTNRNKILDPHGETWLTVPINKKQKFLPNRTVEINNQIPWRDYQSKKMYMCYANAGFFGRYWNYFEELFKKEWSLLFDLDFETIRIVMEWLGLHLPIVKESELKVKGEGTERLINLCKAVGADTYVSGIGGRNYLNERQFENSNLRLEYQNYIPTPYPQRFARSFVPNLSILDMLFNVGPHSSTIVSGEMLVPQSGGSNLMEQAP